MSADPPTGDRMRPQGRCVFCENTGLTKQHIWPKWLKEINQPEVTSHTQVLANTDHRNPAAPTPEVRRRQGHSGTRTARKVCKTCNNGWIERLEERVRGPVTKLMQGEPITLDLDTQRLLAAWLTLVTMMVEFTDLGTLASTPESYAYLYQIGEPPPGWKVWMAKYSGDAPGDHVVRHLGLQLTPFPDVSVKAYKCDTQVTTFVIERLCAHTFCSTQFSGTEGDDYVLIDLPQIWPPTGSAIDWASTRQLTDSGVVSLATAILGIIPPAPP